MDNIYNTHKRQTSEKLNANTQIHDDVVFNPNCLKPFFSTQA